MRLELIVHRLILDGLAPADRAGFGTALQDELRALMAEVAAAPGPVALPALAVPLLTAEARDSARLGRDLARTIHAGLAREGLLAPSADRGPFEVGGRAPGPEASA
jgi:hypothetical protein